MKCVLNSEADGEKCIQVYHFLARNPYRVHVFYSKTKIASLNGYIIDNNLINANIALTFPPCPLISGDKILHTCQEMVRWVTCKNVGSRLYLFKQNVIFFIRWLFRRQGKLNKLADKPDFKLWWNIKIDN